MSSVRCSLCHTGFHPTDIVCDSPVYGDRTGVFHKSCIKQVEAVIDLEGTNDISHILYPKPSSRS